MIHSKVTLVRSVTSHQMLHILTCCHQGPRRVVVFPGYTSELPLAVVWRSGCGSQSLVSHLSVSLDRRYRRKACSQAPPCSMLPFTHKQTQLLLWQGLHTGIYKTAAACHFPWQHLPAFSGDRLAGAELSWEQTVVDCLTNTPSHQQNKVEETAEHMSQGKLWFNIHLISLRQWRTVGLDS